MIPWQKALVVEAMGVAEKFGGVGLAAVKWKSLAVKTKIPRSSVLQAIWQSLALFACFASMPGKRGLGQSDLLHLKQISPPPHQRKNRRGPTWTRCQVRGGRLALQLLPWIRPLPLFSRRRWALTQLRPRIRYTQFLCPQELLRQQERREGQGPNGQPQGPQREEHSDRWHQGGWRSREAQRPSNQTRDSHRG